MCQHMPSPVGFTWTEAIAFFTSRSLLGLALVTGLAGCTSMEPGLRSAVEYSGHWEVPMFSHKDGDSRRQAEPTGLAIADINGDGALDIVVSNGVDNQEADPLVVLNHSGQTARPYSLTNAWVSETHRFYQNVCAGDINNDGCTDVAAVHIKKDKNSLNSIVDLYLNKPSDGACAGFSDLDADQRRFELEPPEEISNVAAAGFNCDFGDVDNDGFVDLAIAFSYCDGSCVTDRPSAQSRGRVAIYPNSGAFDGNFDAIFPVDDVLTYKASLHAGDVRLADVDRDGDLDVVASAMGIRVFAGNPGSFPAADADPSMCWSSDNRYCQGDLPSSVRIYSLGLDLDWHRDETLSIGVAMNNPYDLSKTSFTVVDYCDAVDSACPVYWSKQEINPAADLVFLTSDRPELSLGAVSYSENTPSGSTGSRFVSKQVLSDTCMEQGTGRSARIFWDIDGGDQGEPTKLAPYAGVNILGMGVEILSGERIRKTQTVEAAGVATLFRGSEDGELSRILGVRDSVTNESLPMKYTPGNSWVTLPGHQSAQVVVDYEITRDPTLVVADGCGFVHFFENLQELSAGS